MKSKLSLDEQTRFLAQSIQLEECAAPYSIRATALALSLISILFLAWTAFAEVEEIILAPAEVVPYGFPQTIQHYDGGIVAEIPVHEGSLVTKGDLLIRLDGSGISEELTKARILQQGLQKKMETAEQLFQIQQRLKESGVVSDARYLTVQQAWNDSVIALEQQKQVIAQLEERVKRLSITSPTTGTIKGLKLNTIGAVIRSGEHLMDIIPADQPLVLIAKVSPTDIGQVRLGQKVKMKITAYDFARYGKLEGHLDFITATTSEERDGTRFYHVRIIPDQSYLKDKKEAPLMAGMTAQAGIVTGKKTIFGYLFKPVQRALDNSLTER